MTGLRRPALARGGSRSIVRRIATAFLALTALLGVLHSVVLTIDSVQDVKNWNRWVRGAVQRVPASVTRVMELPRRLDEASGLALSRRQPGVLWTHNDSGGDPVVYGLRPGQGVVAELRLRGAPATDWEDLAAGPCPWDDAEPCIYVADIGDNLHVRSSVVVLVFEEPSARELELPDPARKGDRVRRLDVAWSAARMRYPGGARNAEALTVTGDGDLILVQKNPAERRVPVFRGSRSAVSAGLSAGLAGEPVLLRRDGQLLLPYEDQVTAAAWLPDAELIVRTNGNTLFYERRGDGWESLRPRCFVGHAGPGGEGLEVSRPAVLHLIRERVWQNSPTVDLAVCAL